MADSALLVPWFPRVHDLAGVWCMEAMAFNAHWQALLRFDLARHVEQSLAAAVPAERKSPVEFRPAKNGQNVAVVPILGAMMKQRSSLGGTSTIETRRDLRNAAADPNVSAVVLAVESPGGTVAGTADLAAEVKAARRRKPVLAHIDDLGASAAYWVASQASQVFANQNTALVGSVGTFQTVYDVSAAAEREGVKTLVFATGPHKGAGVQGAPVTEAQQGYFQSVVNGLQLEFDAAVKSGRKMTDRQLAAVKSGGVFPASDAQSLGLIDGVQSLERTIDLAAEMAQPAGKPARAAEHRFELVPRGKFGGFARDERRFGPGVAAVDGYVPAAMAWMLYALCFDASLFTREQAEDWLSRHGFAPLATSGGISS
jgi:signal peptide peptidase SppA